MHECEDQETILRSWFSPVILWSPGTELGSLGLCASTSTYYAVLLAHDQVFQKILNTLNSRKRFQTQTMSTQEQMNRLRPHCLSTQWADRPQSSGNPHELKALPLTTLLWQLQVPMVPSEHRFFFLKHLNSSCGNSAISLRRRHMGEDSWFNKDFRVSSK